MSDTRDMRATLDILSLGLLVGDHVESTDDADDADLLRIFGADLAERLDDAGISRESPACSGRVRPRSLSNRILLAIMFARSSATNG
jgi:hypothetical protein